MSKEKPKLERRQPKNNPPKRNIPKDVSRDDSYTKGDFNPGGKWTRGWRPKP